jgi:hypothetical protein
MATSMSITDKCMSDKSISDEAFVEMLCSNKLEEDKLIHLQDLTKEIEHELNPSYSPIVDKEDVEVDDDLNVPPPLPLQRQIAGEWQHQQNLEMIELFGLADFIEEQKGLWAKECQTPLYVYLNDPTYIQAQQRYLEKKKR